MKLNTLMLADFASVREGTLGVLGGFIDHLWRQEYPAQMGVHLVAVLGTTPGEIEAGHTDASFRFSCSPRDSDEVIFEGEGRLETTVNNGRGANCPMVFDISAAPIPEPGGYSISLELDGEFVGEIEFWSDDAGGAA